MKNQQKTSYDMEFAILINRYATPLAILLTALGVALSQPKGTVRIISITLLVFGIVFNTASLSVIKLAHEAKPWFMELRLCINLGINLTLVYFLGGYWPPIWLLLALTPIATAVYSTRAQTLRVAAGVSVLLLAIHSARRLNSPMEWGQQAACVAFILLLSLMINELAQLARLSKDKWNALR
jgi:hypothetical protein